LTSINFYGIDYKDDSKDLFLLLGLFVIFLFLVNVITAISSQNFDALFYPYNIKKQGRSRLQFIKLYNIRFWSNSIEQGTRQS